MAKLKISKELITNIAEQENLKYINTISKKTNQILSVALKKMSTQVSYLTMDNIVLQPVNELMSGAFVDNSSFVYFLGIKNAQLEMNTGRKTPIWQSIKERLKYAWTNRKMYKRKRKKKKKKKEENNIDIKQQEFDPSKYTIYNLTEDLQNALTNYLSESSMIYINGNQLQIVGKDDFGSNTRIIIYVVNYDGEKFKYYAGKKEGFKLIDIDSRLKCLENKIMTVGENFIKILKVFNSLYYNINGIMCNQIFMESILCSCPEDLFFGDDIYKVFVKIVNYLSIKTLKDIKSINNSQLTIFKDEICGNCGLGFNKMLSKILKN